MDAIDPKHMRFCFRSTCVGQADASARTPHCETARSELRQVLERAKGFEPSTPTLARSCSTPELHPHPLDIWPKSIIGRQGRSYSQKATLKATAATDSDFNPFGTVAVQRQPASAGSDCRSPGSPKPRSPGTLQVCGIGSLRTGHCQNSEVRTKALRQPVRELSQPTRLWRTRLSPEQCAR